MIQGYFFGTSPEFWLNLQKIYELRRAGDKSWKTIKELPTLAKAGRLSCRRCPVRQVRLLLGNTAAYRLFWLLHRHLKGTLPEAAQVKPLNLQPVKEPASEKPTHDIWVPLYFL